MPAAFVPVIIGRDSLGTPTAGKNGSHMSGYHARPNDGSSSTARAVQAEDNKC